MLSGLVEISEITHVFEDNKVRHVMYKTFTNTQPVADHPDRDWKLLESFSKKISHSDHMDCYTEKVYIYKYIKYLD